MTTETLPLFDTLGPESGEQTTTTALATGVPARPHGDPHLRAARKLSKQIRRTPDGSPQQTRAGQLICQHLLAMLHADRDEQRPRQRHGSATQ